MNPPSVPKVKSKEYKLIQGAIGENFLALDLPERAWLIEPLIYMGHLVLLYGAAGVGKTFLCLYLAVCVSRGGELFGPYEAAEPHGVIYLDGEMQANELQERLKHLGIQPDPENFKVISCELMQREHGTAVNLADPRWREAILSFLRDHRKYKFLVLDNLSSLIPGIDENPAKEWDAANQWLLQLRREGVSVLLVHHAGKSGDQRGTSKRVDNVELVLKLVKEEHPRETRFSVNFQKARSLRHEHQKPFGISIHEDQGRISLKYRGAPSQDLTYEVAYWRSQGLKQHEIAEKLNIGQSTVSKKLKKAKQLEILDENDKLTDSGWTSCSFMDFPKDDKKPEGQL